MKHESLQRHASFLGGRFGYFLFFFLVGARERGEAFEEAAGAPVFIENRGRGGGFPRRRRGRGRGAGGMSVGRRGGG